MADNLRNRTINGVLWSGIDRFSSQGITFIFNILIARVLLPEDYGVVAMLNIFIAIAQTFIDSGFGHSLIQKQSRTETDCSTVFFFNLIISTLFCLALWFSAPVIARFYNTPVLISITRVISTTLIINAVGAIQNVKLSIDLNFKVRSIISVCRTVSMGVVGLVLALKGYGIWALVFQNVIGTVVYNVLLCVCIRWVPRMVFSWQSLKTLFSFGSKLLVTNLINSIWSNLYNLVVGKVFSPTSLGLYNRAESFATFPSANIYGMLQSVMFPSLCTIQDDTERLRSAYRQFVKLSSYVVFPLMFGLASVADPFTRLILTDKWAEMIPLLRVLCFSLILYPLNAININFPNIVGKSDLYLKNVVYNKIIELFFLIATIPLGLMAMCVGKIVSALVVYFINTKGTKTIITYGPFDQIKDIAHTILHSIIMSLLVIVVVHFANGNALRLTLGILTGVTYYLSVSLIFKCDEFLTLKNIVLGIIKK